MTTDAEISQQIAKLELAKMLHILAKTDRCHRCRAAESREFWLRHEIIAQVRMNKAKAKEIRKLKEKVSRLKKRDLHSCD